MNKAYNIYRKPFPTLFNILKSKTKIKFYCGDMETDAKFAKNATIPFIYIESFLIDEKSEMKITYPVKFEKIEKPKVVYHEHEMIILIGFPASGKSSFAKLFEGYVIINRDTIKTKMMKLFKESIDNNENIIIDNLNNKIEDRKKFIDEAKKKNYHIRCIVINTNLEKSYHNMFYRMYKYKGTYLPIMIYRTYAKRYVEPTKKEGIDEIEYIEMQEPEEDEDYYLMFY
jgi:predicted kinase